MTERNKIMVGTIGHIPVPNRGSGFKSHLSMALAAPTIAMLNERKASLKPTKKQLQEWLVEAMNSASVREGGIDMALLSNRIGDHAFKAGITAAVTYLTGTAEDFEQMSTRRINSRSRPTAHEREEAKSCEDKAALLRGQAGHIAGLKQL
jgi:hypothetical protein